MKNVLILSEGFGAGHTQTANAIAKGLKQSNSNIQTHVLELGSSLHPFLAPVILKLYKQTVFSHPKLYGKLYQTQNKRVTKRAAQLALHKIFYTEAYELIQKYNPEKIICTHPFPTMVISRLKRLGLDIPLITVITDYNLHQAWLTKECDTYFISNSEMKDKMIQNGIPASKIVVSGIPVDPDFMTSYSKQTIRKNFNLEKMPTVLVMGGGWGVLNYEDLLNELLFWKEKIQIIICLGNNEKALNELSSNSLFQHPNIKLQGFTKNINQLMEVSDLLITKPGGVTSTEAIAKQLPMLFFNPIPGQEEENCKFFVKNNLGMRINTFDQLNERLSQLITNKIKNSEFIASKYEYNANQCMDQINHCVQQKVV
ncbi:MGDG synthase family glycosyltransferase [Chengkuizengella axinellae]|uniref:Glycosyltransferase n=1 Tax=Chengkuizengella axinellae TaxID=3064388 RepID=A0ABT9ITB9_9BACL|nr:glycosyltransferase [Chengkuizengella sp. 2205SS18-9]MDP5272599.1 glycosyltransferase [Chengkuizengella sp. 2205SS18-9]